MNKTLFTTFLIVVTLLLAAPRQAQASNWFSRFDSSHDRDDDKKREEERKREDERERNRRGHKKHGRSPHKDDTIVAGTIFDGSHNAVNGDQDFEKVTVTCNGNVKTGDIGSDGRYSVTFKKNKCNDGDSVTTSAVTEQGTGSNTTTVYDDPDEGPCGDADVTVLDVSVPEFGIIGMGLTGLTSVAGYLLLRTKSIV